MEFKKEELVKALTKQKAQLDAERLDHANTKQVLEGQNFQLQQELREAKEQAARCAELAFRLDEIEQSRETLLQKLVDEEGGRREIETSFDTVRLAFDNERRDFEIERARFQGLEASWEAQIQDFRAERDMLRVSVDSLQHELSEKDLVLQAERLRATEDRQNLKSQLSVGTETEELKAALAREAELKNLLESEKKLYEERASENLKLLRQLEETSDKGEELERAVSQERFENGKLEGALNELRTQYEAEILTRETLLSRIHELEASLLENTKEPKEGDLSAAELRKALDDEKANSQAEQEKFNRLQTSFKETVEDLQERARIAEAELDARFEKQDHAIKERSDKVERLELDLQEALKEVDRARDENAALRLELERVHLQLERNAEDAGSQIRQAEEKLIAMEQQRNEAQRTLSGLTIEVEEQRALHSSKTFATVEAGGEIQELRQRLETEIGATERLRRDLETLDQRCNEQSNARRQAEGKLDDMMRGARNLEEELAASKLELANSSARFESMLSGQPGPWIQQAVDDEMPVPTHVTLDSPVIQTILQAWTQDQKNLSFFNKWCSYILGGGDVGPSAQFQKGVELSKCTTSVKDGILSMLIPMLRARSDIDVSVFTRERLQVYHDVRLRITRTEMIQ